MTVLLIDPRILLPSDEKAELSATSEYWRLVIEWSADKRARLGFHTRELLCERFAKYGYPQNDMPVSVAALRGPFRAAINNIMARVLPPDGEVEACEFDPRYKGTPDELIALQMDVSSTRIDGVVGIATVPSSWDETASTIMVKPPPPAQLVVCFEPSRKLEIEQESELQEFFSSRRLFVVGGRPDPCSVKKLQQLGLSAERVIWTPSEKSKPPRNLDDKWSGLNADRDITVCITGRIGHSESGKAEDLAQRRGVTYIPAETANEAIRALKRYASTQIAQ